ncbi:MAG: prolipoprotein diacylglyceryl transferase family protein, partial [Candidatus Moraniibacteriota bacterium]
MSIGWQLLPLNIHPIAFSIGFFSVSWYALCYFLGAFFVILALARSKRREAELGTDENFWTLLSFVLWGVLLGARLGYVVFYGTGQFWGEPWHIFSPYDFTTGAWVGIRGLSFFGGLFGGVVGLFLFVRKHQLSFLRLSDWIVPFLPIAIFMGR